MKIKVEQKHIDKGVPKHQSCCPVALAFKDAGFKDAHVMSFGTYVNKGYDDEQFWFHSTPISEFIADFDKERPVKPIEFHVEHFKKPKRLERHDFDPVDERQLA